MTDVIEPLQALAGAPPDSGEIQALAQHRRRTCRYDGLSAAAQSWERDWRASFAGAIL